MKTLISRCSWILTAVTLLISLPACRNENENLVRDADEIEVQQEAEAEYMSFEEALSSATDVLTGKFVSYTTVSDEVVYTELEFEVEEVLKGETDSEVIYVFEVPTLVSFSDMEESYLTATYDYTVGESYLLVLSRRVSVYYEHDRYYQEGEIYIPLSEPTDSMMYTQPLTLHNTSGLSLADEEDLLSSIEGILVSVAAEDNTESSAYFGSAYIDSEDISELAAASDYVFSVQTVELLVEGVYAQTETWICKIETLYKGDISESVLSGRIYVVFFSGQVSAGEEYIVMASRSGPDSLIFTLTSENSVISCEDTSAISMLEETLSLC